MPAIVSKLKKRLKPEDTAERCGLILDRGKVIEVTNSHPEPTMGFAIPVREIHDRADSVKGTWHTHPNQSAALSQDDYLGFSAWPDLTHYIIGVDGVRAYVADEFGIIKEIPCE